MIPYKLIRKGNCKRLRIRIRQGEVIVTSPYYESDERITQFLKENQEWIVNQLNIQQSSLLKDGDTISVFGKPYTICISHTCLVKDTTFYIRHQKDFELCTTFLSENLLEPLVKDILRQVNLNELKVQYKPFKSKWGSFNARTNTMKLNSYLIYTSKAFAISVILHECAHYYEMNHSKRFYDILESWLPDYKKIQSPYKHFTFPQIQ